MMYVRVVILFALTLSWGCSPSRRPAPPEGDIHARIQNFQGQEINLDPSSYTPPRGLGSGAGVQDDVFAGTTANRSGVPFGTNAEPSPSDVSRDAGISFNDSIHGSYAGGRIENLYDSTVRRFGDPESLRDFGVDFRGLGGHSTGIGASSVRDCVGAGLPAEAALNPSAGAYFGQSDGDFRGRTENVLENDLLPQVSSVAFPKDWLDQIARLDPHFEAEDYDVEVAQTSFISRVIKKPRSWKPSTLRPNTSRLLVGRDDPLPQESFAASVRIDGFRARVTLSLVFRNDRDKQLHGSFQLRLPDGASVHYLAFGKSKLETPAVAPPTGVLASMPEIRSRSTREIEKPREARMVPRERAAHAFEETVRQRIDPALAEWTGAGVFRVQVYPLEPNTSHRIVLAYDTDVMPVGQGLLYRLDVPRNAKDVRVDLEARGGPVGVAPRVQATNGVYRWENPKRRVILAGFARPQRVLLQGSDPATGPLFAARVAPALPDVPAAARERAVFLVDASLSSNPQRMVTYRALLRSILEKNRVELKQFAVLFFNVDAWWWREGFQANTQANVDALLGTIDGLVLEGATDLGRALRAAATRRGAFDVFMLSDGAATWGEDDLHVMAQRLGADRAVFAYRTAVAGTHVAALNHIARETGGAVFNVLSEPAIAKAAVAHRSRPWRLLGAAVDDAADVLLAGRPVSVYPGQTLYVAGRGAPKADATLTLTLEQDGRERTVRVPLGRPLDSPLASRTYGQIATAQLESLSSTDDLATAFANHFRVVGRSSSLLMLESEEDYKRFAIEPANDAARVRDGSVSMKVARAMLAALAVSRGDPKVRFLHRLAQLRTLDLLGLTFPEGFDEAVRALPASAFDVTPPRRFAAVRRRDQAGSALAASLRARDFTYASLSKEAVRRREGHGAWDGLKALSTLVEHTPGDLDLARDLGMTAMAWGLEDQAYHLLRRVADRRPYQLPTLLAMARCAAAMGKHDLALVHYETALASKQGGERYGAFGEIATLEYLTFLRGLERPSKFAAQRADALRYRCTLHEADVLVLMTWNTDRTDVDLHVTDPAGEECYYSHVRTQAGGRITGDVTQGFGPEMFVLEKAPKGDYKIEINYFGSDATRTHAPSRVYLRIYEDFGRPSQRLTRKAIELGSAEERRTVATVRR